MRIVTMLLITLLTVAAGIGAWIVLKSDMPSGLTDKRAEPEKPQRKQLKWREAPYVILTPAETLPEKSSAVSPPPREPAKPKGAPPPAAPSPAQPAIITATAPAKAPTPVAQKAKPAKSSIAQQALESVLGPPKISPPPTAKSKKKLQLPYEANADSRAVALQKQQAVLARKQLRFRKAVPLSSGMLKSDEITISLAGLDALAADAQCTYASGNDWECGRWGKYALRRLIRGRTISCDVVERITENIVTASCDVAGVDINRWVVRRGWGRPSGEGDKKYDIALRAAKSDKLGQWSVEASVKQN